MAGVDSPEPIVAAGASAPARSAPARKGGLGRGLGALIPAAEPTGAVAATLEVDIDAIAPNPYQPRALLDPEALQTLAASIRAIGIVQPLVVTEGPERGRFVLIAGERRWRAARLAGLTAVPIVVKEAAPRHMLELALVENVVRADLSPLEEAAAYRQLIDDFGLTQSAIAERVGRSRVSITNTLRLLAAPDAVQAALSAGEITEGHARALLGLPSAADQIAALEIIVERNLTVRQTEELVRRWLDGAPPRKPAPKSLPPVEQAFVDRIGRTLGARVSLRRGRGGGGALTIHFGSDEALNAFYGRLVEDDEL
jgi:ParB family transcriptional regulator, chromosome partitioning protein